MSGFIEGNAGVVPKNSTFSTYSWRGELRQSVAEVTVFTEGTIEVGKIYEITAYSLGDDFTNVGAEYNDEGVRFVATGDTPAVWTHASTLTEQSCVYLHSEIENTFGFEIDKGSNRLEAGVYRVKLKNRVPSTYQFAKKIGLAFDGGMYRISQINGGAHAGKLLVETFSDLELKTPADGILSNTVIDLQWYPVV